MSEAGYTAQLMSMKTKALTDFDGGLSSAVSALASAIAQQGQAADVAGTGAAGQHATDPQASGPASSGQSASSPSGAAPTTADTQSAPAQQSQAPTPGSATVVGSAADSEYAFDNSFTPALVSQLTNNPELSLDDALKGLSAGSIGTGTDNDAGLHHPTIVQYGQTDENTNQSRDNKKLAVLVANQNYTAISSLGTPIAEANSMSSALTTRGYDANVHNDRTAAQMGTLWNSMVGAAQEGDDLVAFYGGHGAPEGLVGVSYSFNPKINDIFANSAVEGVVSSATSKGAHIRFVMDSCHSGHAAQAVRTERQNELAAQSDSIEDHVRVAALTAISGAKQMLVEHVEHRERDLNRLDDAIAQHQSQKPPTTDLVGTAKYRIVLAGLRAVRAGTESYYDTQADALWAGMALALAAGRRLAGHAEPTPALTDYRTLGAQINYLDDLWNTVSQPMERDLAKQQAGS